MNVCMTILILISTIMSFAYADCYQFNGGNRDIVIGVEDPQTYSVNRFCLTGEYAGPGESGILIFTMYQDTQEVASYYARSIRDSNEKVIFNIRNGEIKQTQLAAEFTGNKLKHINIGDNQFIQLSEDNSAINRSLEKYTLECTDANIITTPYFNFRIELANSTGPALGEGTAISLFAAYNDYYGTESPAVMIQVNACQNIRAKVTSVSNFSASCGSEDSAGDLELNIISNYGLATGTIFFTKAEANLGIAANSKFNIVCRAKP